MVIVICLLRFLLETANFHQREHTAQNKIKGTKYPLRLRDIYGTTS